MDWSSGTWSKAIGKKESVFGQDIDGDDSVYDASNVTTTAVSTDTSTTANTAVTLTKDAQGVKWVEFEPSFSEGIFVYNEETLVGTSSFRGLNLITSGGGSLKELVEGSVNPNNPNIADIAIRLL